MALADVLTSPDTYLERAITLQPLLERLAPDSEMRRSVHPDAIAALKEAGLYRITQPRRIGGAELDLRAMHRVVRALAWGCPAASWVLMVQLAHTWILGMFPEAVQDEIAADDPDTVISGSLAAAGRAVPVEGGWRVSGRFPFASGVDHARWNLLGVHVPDAGPGVPRQIHVMAPTRDYEVHDNWFTMGLRGTGSKELVLENVFVPEHRAVASAALFKGRSEWAQRHPTWLHMMPVVIGLAYHLSGVILGIAESTQAMFVDRMRARGDKYTGSAKAESPGLQFRVAEAELEIRSADLILDRVADTFEMLAAERRLPTIEERADLRFTIAYAVQQCRRAVERLFAAAGANACYESSPLQSRFRDMNVAVHHAMVDFDGAAEQLGRVRLGLPPNSTVL